MTSMLPTGYVHHYSIGVDGICAQSINKNILSKKAPLALNVCQRNKCMLKGPSRVIWATSKARVVVLSDLRHCSKKKL